MLVTKEEHLIQQCCTIPADRLLPFLNPLKTRRRLLI